MTRAFGAIPSAYDPRDYSVRMTAGALPLPSAYMAQDAEIYDQGKIGNCVMQALSSAPHVYYGRRMGVTFGYGRWRTHSTSGMRPAEACNGFVKEGIPPMEVDSKLYEVPDAIDYAAKNAARLLAAAKPYVGWTWARVRTVDEIKAVVYQAEQRPGTRCIVCLPHAMIRQGYWYTKGNATGYHEMAIVGWDDTKQAFRLRNSWGADGSITVPKGGYLWVEYDEVFACDDVIALFPPEKQEEAPEPIIVARRTLRLKSKPRMEGEDVREMQTRLNVHGVACDVDGVFGPATDTAVKTFQRAKKLVVDGICGDKTWVALDKEPDVQPAPEPSEREQGLVRHSLAHIGDVYVWGGNGQTEISAGWIRRMDTSESNAQRSIRFWEKQKAAGMTELAAFDCSGLISRYLQDLGLVASKRNCNHLWAMCEPVTRAELRPGNLLFRENSEGMYHVGVYIGGGKVVEAKGRDDGVVLRGIDASGMGYWEKFGALEVLK